MEQEKNYSLLRPFDLEAAKRGDFVQTTGDDERGRFIAENDSEIVIDFERTGFVIYEEDILCQLRMKPLCWVEGRPVYKWDVLYWVNGGICWKVTAVDTGVQFDDGSVRTYVSVRDENFTWNKPKVKREGWMNCYPEGENYVYITEERANQMAGSTRTACVRIEWEE